MASTSDAVLSGLGGVAGAGPAPDPARGRVGMLCLIASEAAVFATFLVAYLFYLGKSPGGPSPDEVLDVPVLNTVCLLSSSVAITFAVRRLRRGHTRGFTIAWLLGFSLGAEFLIGSLIEFQRLIEVEGFTIASNLFGTTFYSLVGLHAAHVLAGLVLLGTVSVISLCGRLDRESAERVDLVSWYWHFVDGVWVFVFTAVYVVGR